jgi:hypothetical protein
MVEAPGVEERLDERVLAVFRAVPCDVEAESQGEGASEFAALGVAHDFDKARCRRSKWGSR